jgi:hypothetical protein
VPHSAKATCSGMVYSDTELMVVLTNLASGVDVVASLVRARGRRPYSFRGFRRPLSRGAACRSYGSGRHSVTELTLASPHSSPAVPGMAARGGLAEQHRDMIPMRYQRAGVARIRF